jgi:2-polyprenyl-6-hydroxyphenyl methylase/3-demethylubiquinone-9 3-methyltransferase
MATEISGTTASRATSVDPREVEKFSAIAAGWWDPEGEMKPLHRLNPTRLAYLRDAACRHFGRDARSTAPLEGLQVLDVGCGVGLIAEPLARLGATVLAIDAAEENLKAAEQHAVDTGLRAEVGERLTYRCATAEALLDEGASFDLVVTLEVVEHVPDPQAFLQTCGNLVAGPDGARGSKGGKGKGKGKSGRAAQPAHETGGLLVMATLNRTWKSLAMAKVGAEYVLRWLPAGTHDWRKFVKPSEAASGLRAAGLTVTDVTGIVYNPLTDAWRQHTRDRDVNYMLTAVRG